MQKGESCAGSHLPIGDGVLAQLRRFAGCAKGYRKRSNRPLLRSYILLRPDNSPNTTNLRSRRLRTGASWSSNTNEFPFHRFLTNGPRKCLKPPDG